MADTHLLLQTDHGWQVHCGASLIEAVVPLSLKHRVTCPGCQQWPQPAVLATRRPTAGPHTLNEATIKPMMSRTLKGETVLSTGLAPLIGGRGQPMNTLELAFYTVLIADAMVLAVHYEPFPLPLGKGVQFWCDFEVLRWGYEQKITREWIEVKSGEYTEAGNIVARYYGDGRTKWKIFCDRWHHLGVCKLAIGWKEQGAYRWNIQEEN